MTVAPLRQSSPGAPGGTSFRSASSNLASNIGYRVPMDPGNLSASSAVWQAATAVLSVNPGGAAQQHHLLHLPTRTVTLTHYQVGAMSSLGLCDEFLPKRCSGASRPLEAREIIGISQRTVSHMYYDGRNHVGVVDAVRRDGGEEAFGSEAWQNNDGHAVQERDDSQPRREAN